MKFLSIVAAVTGFANKTMDWLLGRQKEAEREELREAGRNDQRLADSDKAVDRAREANAREEDLSRLSGDALDERMRKSME